MTWHHAETMAWAEPLAFAAAYANQDMAMLYSGMRERFSGDVSYLFLEPQEVIEGNDWGALPHCPFTASGNDLPRWVGYLAYELGDATPINPDSFIALPKLRFIRYGTLFRFHHEQQTIDRFVTNKSVSATTANAKAELVVAPIEVTRLASNVSRSAYERSVADTLACIEAGAFYQANITRKFFGELKETPYYWHVFFHLTQLSPAPYSAYIRHQNTAILSSSPECFLQVDASGKITTRPIKGSARRHDDAAIDATIQHALRTSAKNHAENLMIVDLMRNDLSRVSVTGSVNVVEQSALYSYATIHHLISTIQAQKQSDISCADVVRACFPAGSMTGAPKIAAMRWCAEQEKIARGVYSGAMGWFGNTNNCDLSVVIRTLILQGNRFEFQVGGGIVADSTPEDEWRETITKARGVAGVLGLSEDDLAAL